MALIQANFYSVLLKRTVMFNLVLPVEQCGGPLRLVILLHDYGESCGSFLSGGDIRSLAEGHGTAVLMPNDENHFYVDAVRRGDPFSRHIGKEVPDFCRSLFPLSSRREDTVIAGLRGWQIWRTSDRHGVRSVHWPYRGGGSGAGAGRTSSENGEKGSLWPDKAGIMPPYSGVWKVPAAAGTIPCTMPPESWNSRDRRLGSSWPEGGIPAAHLQQSWRRWGSGPDGRPERSGADRIFSCCWTGNWPGWGGNCRYLPEETKKDAELHGSAAL